MGIELYEFLLLKQVTWYSIWGLRVPNKPVLLQSGLASWNLMWRVGGRWGHSLGPARGDGGQDAVRPLEWRRRSEPERNGGGRSPRTEQFAERMEGREDFLEFTESLRCARPFKMLWYEKINK